MFSKRTPLMLLAIAAVLAALAMPVFAQQPPPAPGDEDAQIATLRKADASMFERAKACQTLALVGTKKCVPVLAGMLSDEKLAHYARFGLEPIPDPSVDEVFRTALGKLQGMLLVGVIDSIGNRRDAAAVDALTKLLGSADKQVAAAAASALGRIGNRPCIEALRKALTGPAALRTAVGDACFSACDVLLAEGKRDEAAALYDAVLAADVPKPIKIAAAHGAIAARGAAGVPRVVEYLKSDDPALFRVGLRMAHELPATEVTKALVAELAEIEPVAEAPGKMLTIVKAVYGMGDKQVDVTDVVKAALRDNQLSVTAGNHLAGDPAPGIVKRLRLVYKLGDKEATVEVAEKESIELAGDKLPQHPRQVLLISVLGDLGDKAALPAVLKAAATGPYDVRVAAIRALAVLGDERAVPVLLKAAVDGAGEVAGAALASAAALKGEAVDHAIAEALQGAQGKSRAVLIDLVGRRGIRSAVPALLKAADDTNPVVSLAAIEALGVTAGLEQLPALTKRLIAPRNPVELAAVRKALQTAAQRSPDRDAYAEKLIEAMSGAPPAGKVALIELLGSLGGAKALKAVAGAARSDDTEIQDAATRVLGGWMSPDAAPVLLDLAKTLKAEKFKVRAMRGYIRIPRQLGLADDEKLAMCQTAMGVAWRDAERKLALDALTRIHSPKSLAVVLQHLGTPGMKEAASAAAVAISEKILNAHPAAVAKAMKQVVEATANKETLSQAKLLRRRAERKLRGR